MTSTVPEASFEFALTRREKVFTIVGTLLGLLLAALDQTIVATAGPSIQRDLNVSPSLYPWITTAYLVASTVMVPVYGKLSDLFGRRPILLVGIGLFLLGSLACGLSRTALTLVASRALQGLGSAALFTSAFAVVADIFAPAERGKYQGIFGGCFALSSVVGPLVGGFLTDHLSWHWVFFVNLPLGAIAVAFIVTRMPVLRRPLTRTPRIDWPGALCLLIAVVPFLVVLSLGQQALADPHVRGVVLGLLAASGFGAVAFVRVERRAREPLLDFALFENRVFAVGNLATFVLGASFLGAIVFLPLFMVNVVGLSATSAGLTLMPLTFGIVAGNVLSGQIVARVGRYRPILLFGIALQLVGFALLGFTLRPDSTQAEVTFRMVALGLGLGPTVPLYTLAIQNAVPPRSIGVATASATFFRQIGSTVGVSVLGVVFAATLARESRAIPPVPELAALAARTPPLPAPDPAEGPRSPASPRLHVDVTRERIGIERAYSHDPAARSRALAALNRLDRETKLAFTRAIESVHRFALVFSLIGLLITLRLPELPLRRGAPAPSE